MTEAELQRLVAELCARLGLHHYHTYDSRRSEPGFPDSVIVGTMQYRAVNDSRREIQVPAILFRELKSADGVLKPEQRRWGSRLERAGADWAVWRPADWRNMTIMNQLMAIRPVRASA